VATSSYVNGNYTYTTEYIFRMDGGIDVRVGATGTTLNRGVASVAQGNQFGSSVAANIAAPSHQHFFNFRIDFDVDGSKNRIVELNTHTVPSNLGDAFVTDSTTLQTEQFRDLNPATNRRWAIQSATNTNALSQLTAYELDPIDYSQPYSQPGYTPLQHALFAQHALWVTQYRADEMYATGTYPNQSSAGQGLPNYVAQNGSVNGQDSVVWYTAGFTHDPTVEEYPVMTRESIGFSMRPAGFFNQNPALDAP
jgi:primary-amine oxidase